MGEAAPLRRVATLRHPQRPRLLHVLLEDADGVVGLGETIGRAAVVEALVHELAAALVGAPATPAGIAEVAWRGPYGARRGGGPVSVESQAASALDIAAHDLAARRSARPLRDLLGTGGRDAVALYATALDGGHVGFGLGDPPGPLDDHTAFLDDPAALAARVRDDGFATLKVWPFAPGRDIAADVERVRAAQASGIAVAVDVAEQLPPAEAEALCARLDPLGLAWLEDPLAADATDALARLARRLATPLVVGEQLAGADALGRLVAAVPLVALHLDLGWCGGPGTACAVAPRAAAAGARLALHDCSGPVTWATSVHLAAALPEAPLVECARTYLAGPYATIADGVPAVVRAHAQARGPGHGVALADAYRGGAVERETVAPARRR